MSKKRKEIRQQQRKAWDADKGRRKKLRHNTAANQEKHRVDWQPLVPDEEGQIADQRIMPLDERDRREAVTEQATAVLQTELDDAPGKTWPTRRRFCWAKWSKSAGGCAGPKSTATPSSVTCAAR
jgi:hypothetical protein